MTKKEIIFYLSGGNDRELFERSSAIRYSMLGRKVYLRGLIELSNICSCDCLYCGIRQSNSNVKRYLLSKQEVLQSARYAYDNGWGSLVIQSGELCSDYFTTLIEELVQEIKTLSGGELAITLSCGEQSKDTYRRWLEAGADRYLLRIESSTQELFERIHPQNISYTKRLNTLQSLIDCGFQTGSGVMIGLPLQTIDNLADDMLFLANCGIVMCGMGPYIEHCETPLFKYNSEFSHSQRVQLTLRCIAILRILRPKINIASSTALGTLSKQARHQAMEVGANVIMPNITPEDIRANYSLYQGKISDLDLNSFDIEYFNQGIPLEVTSK